ncbi:hypothetical protein ROU88_03005, partial [Macrococcus capreoli]
YAIENALYKKIHHKKLIEYFKESIEKDKFPKNLTFIDAHLDKANGLCASAFLDDKTGKVIIGLTGTNNDTSLLHATKDWIANANIALSVRNAKDPYYKPTQAFIEKIDKKYDIDTFTGHSKGGHDAIILGLHNKVDNIVVYNSAPVYHEEAPNVPFLFPTERQLDITMKHLFDKWSEEDNKIYSEDLLAMEPESRKKLEQQNLKKLKSDIKNYKGNLTWFVTNYDFLNWININTGSTTAGNNVLIDNELGHGMSSFHGKDAQTVIMQSLMNPTKEFISKTQTAIYEKAVKHNLQKLDQLSIRLSNSGSFTSNHQIMLDKVTSFFIVSGYKNIIEEFIKSLTSEYEKCIEKYKLNWSGTIENANFIGDCLSSYEQIEALEHGGPT